MSISTLSPLDGAAPNPVAHYLGRSAPIALDTGIAMVQMDADSRFLAGLGVVTSRFRRGSGQEA